MPQEIKQPTNFLTQDDQTIVALCTPRGSGAIALIRLCGNDVFSIVSLFASLANKETLSNVASHTIHYGRIVDQALQAAIDNVLFLVMRAPRTFTGQDTIEITCHNNQFIIDHIISIAIKHGARLAQRGEFTRRAFLSGKLDLVQAEAINELIHAQSEEALKRSLQMLDGSLSSYLQALEQQIVQLLSYVEASFEFLEEEQRDLAFDDMIKERLQLLCERVAYLKKQFAHQKQIREGVRVVLYGCVNVGKSTLFNALLGQERAIVTDIAGTTRDTIEATCYRQGIFWTFIDTAGMRQSHDIIEQKGIEKTAQEVASADVVLLVLDAHNPPDVSFYSHIKPLLDAYKDKIIVVINKTESSQADWADDHEVCAGLDIIKISAMKGNGIPQLLERIDCRIQKICAQSSAPFLINQRHAGLLVEIEQGLEFIANRYSREISYELMAYHLRQLLEKLAQITGRGVSERVLNTVFDTFCVGK